MTAEAGKYNENDWILIKTELRLFYFHVSTYFNSNLNLLAKANSSVGNTIGSRNDHKNHPNQYSINKKLGHAME